MGNAMTLSDDLPTSVFVPEYPKLINPDLIMVGGRGSGKTQYLIELSCKTQCPIIVYSDCEKNNILHMAGQTGILSALPMPIAWENKRSLYGRKEKFLIDDFDRIVAQELFRIFGDLNVKEITAQRDTLNMRYGDRSDYATLYRNQMFTYDPNHEYEFGEISRIKERSHD